MQGDLGQTPLAGVIRELYSERKSGILHLNYEDTDKRIYFRKGSIIFANSDLDYDRLGEFLIRTELIDRDAFEDAAEAMKATGQRFGRTLVEMGVCSTDEMEAKVVEQIQAIVYSVFAWNGGSFRFEQHESPVDEDIVLSLSTADLILEGIRRMENIDSIRRALGESNSILAHSENPLLLYQKISLNPSEGFVLSRVAGGATVADITSLSPLGEDETLRCVYGLISAGVLEIKSRGVKVQHAGVVPPPTPETKAEAPPVASSPKSPPSSPPPKATATPKPKPKPAPAAAATEADAPSGDPSSSDGASEEEKAVKIEITTKHASLGESTLYQLLEIEQTSNEEQIKKAYYSMAKKYHPDRHHSPYLRHVHGLLEELFVKVTNAYQTLSAPAERARYDKRLKTSQPVAANETGKPTEGISAEHSKRMAADQYREGKKHFYEMHFFDAIQCLRESVRLDPNNFDYRRLLAQSLTKNPLWRKEAEEHFRAALKMEPFDAECFVGLGEIYDEAGMGTRAKKMYQQALTYDPENEEALKRIGGVPTEATGGGLKGIKRLFGRKKDQ